MRVGIIGATGAVGQQMIACLNERAYVIEELRLFASPNSVGKTFVYKGQTIIVQTVKEDSFKGLDYVLGATSNELARQYLPLIKAAGALFIDNSSAFRLDDDVPLVVPTINPLDAYQQQGVIANPNCSTIIALTAAAVVDRIYGVKSFHACTYQAVSGAGVGGMHELKDQLTALSAKQEITIATFPRQIAYNAIPCIGAFLDNGYTKEEMKMQNEGRKILHNEELLVDCTCVRVPVMRSHAIALSLHLKEKPDLAVLEEAFKNSAGIIYKATPDYPTPLTASDQDKVEVGRLRYDLCDEKGIALFCAGDQIRRGAASNAIDIMELFI